MRLLAAPRANPKKSLAPAELFDHRLASLLGCTVEEMLERLTPAQYANWQRYWVEEPWGPWRDNLHAAIIARASISVWLKKGQTVDMDQFMVRRRERDAADRVTSFVNTLFAMSQPPGAAKAAEKARKRAKARKRRQARRRKQ